MVLARGDHLEAIRSTGLTLHSPLGDGTVHLPATDDPSTLHSCDLVVFATKTWQLPEAFARAQPHLRAATMVMGLQNGVESIDLFARSHRRESVLGGTCRIISYVESPGVIRHEGVDPTITFGEPAGGLSERAEEVRDTLHVADRVWAVLAPDIVGALWRKFIPFAAISGVGSVERLTIGRVLEDPRTRALVQSAISEATSVAQAQGVALGPEDEDEAFAFLDSVPYEGTSSMHRDFEAGRRTELEALSGYLSRRGRELGTPTPTHDLIYEALLPLEERARGEAALGPAQR